jgi:hypothetical protein
VKGVFNYFAAEAQRLKETTPNMPVELRYDFEDHRDLRVGRFTLTIEWRLIYSNSVQDADFHVTLYDGPAPRQGAYRMKPAKVVGSAQYAPYYGNGDQWVWQGRRVTLKGEEIVDAWLKKTIETAYARM